MKFVHAADIHLDSPLRGLESYEGAPVAQIRGATRRAFENLVQLSINERVDFLLIAGDVYDGDWKDYNTGLFFLRQLATLKDAGIPVFLIRGNHDAESQITLGLHLPDNAFEFPSNKAHTKVLDDLGVAIHGQSFKTRSVTEDLAAAYPAAFKDFFNIGLLHTSAGGRVGHENYAPCTIPGLLSKEYDYWALGHVHQREVIMQDPWIIFPGNLQGRHARETGNKGCTLVTVEDGHVTQVAHRELDVARWCESIVAVDGSSSLEDVLGRIRESLVSSAENCDGRIMAARIILRGRCHAHEHISSNYELLLNESRALANEVGSDQLWIEKILVDTQSELNLDDLATRDDPIGELLRYIRSLPEDVTALAEFTEEFKALALKLPQTLQEGTEGLHLTDSTFYTSRLSNVERILLPLLVATGEGI